MGKEDPLSQVVDRYSTSGIPQVSSQSLYPMTLIVIGLVVFWVPIAFHGMVQIGAVLELTTALQICVGMFIWNFGFYASVPAVDGILQRNRQRID